ncbi:MAG: MupG family TIM beta-alpha barrel fold protein [Defluviitaleaceae bacterium]|nr:MupG family TIM beta-alpha barrel fold protein [Defluviitaleaceae bacterium]
MPKLGISIYPEKSTYEQDKAYLDLAHQYGFKRVFTSLLQIEGDKEEVLRDFKKVVNYATELGMEVMVDIAPNLFTQLEISYDDLSFFHELGAYGIRLDVGFTGSEEARMTRNPYGLKIEINMSVGTRYLDQIMSYSPNRENLIGSHNFYPMLYTGLDNDFFVACSEDFRRHNINTACFVSSQDATFGPWDICDGLASLEAHRLLPIETQVKHLMMIDLIDDIIIGNAYASEAELKAMSDAFFAPHPEIKVELKPSATEVEQKIVYDELHSYRGDRSAYLLRSTMTRVKYAKEDFPPHDTELIKRGDILVCNNELGRYNGELDIALKEMENTGRVNVVGRIKEDEMILLDHVKPWSTFKLVKG